jgi:Intracellular proteinase inhibitor
MKSIVAALVLVSFVACAGQDELTGDRRDVGVVTVVFTAMPAQVEVGQPVRLRLRLSDNAGTAQHLASPTAQLYDFWATDHGREVWRWSQDQSFVQSLTTTTIPGQSSQIYSEVWRPSSAGRFAVYGEVKADGFAGPLKGVVVVQ